MRTPMIVLCGLSVGLSACRRGASPSAPPPPLSAAEEAAEDAVSQRRGRVIGGEYLDEASGYAVPVPVGWVWEEGPESAALQLRMTDPAEGTTVEVWRFSGTDYSLRPREDCSWRFYDHGLYGGPGGLMMRTVGSCVPDDARAARVFGWMVETPEAAWQLEGHVLPDSTIRGLAVVRSVVAQFRILDND